MTSSGTSFIYVLKLEQGNYYVGSTNNLVRRLKEHRDGGGAEWTRRFPPIGGFFKTRVASGDVKLDEDKEVKEQMKAFGVEHVRGGSYSQATLTEEQTVSLTRELWHSDDKCLRCGCAGHWASNCFARSNVLGDLITEASVASPQTPSPAAGHKRKSREVCQRCGRENHTADKCYAKSDANGAVLEDDDESGSSEDEDDEDEDEDEPTCYRCGRVGHISRQCFAKTSVDGKRFRGD
jgi:predicted GIY-YIG superfamily endonuclease